MANSATMNVTMVGDEVIIWGNVATVFSKTRMNHILLALAVIADKVERFPGGRTFYNGDVAMAVHFEKHGPRYGVPHLVCNADFL